jgi:hypothetical protein
MWLRLLNCGVTALAVGAIAHETLTTTVLFDREIVRILDKHCVMCHYKDGPTFPLETYDQTWVRARKIRSEAIARHMPPWSAFPGYGHFANDNGLTLRETQFIVSWVEGNGPRNAGTVFTNTADPTAAPRKDVAAHPDVGHWQLGEPSLKLSAAASVIDPGLKTERRIKAVEYLPADRHFITAAFFKVQETGQWIGAWTPWYSYLSLPKGFAWRIPAGAHIVADIRYRGTNPPPDHGTIGLYFADQPTPRIARDLVIDGKTRLTTDTDAIAMRLDISDAAQSIEVSARKPDGTTEVMLFEKNIRADWPTPYIFKDPVALPKGSEVAVTAHYPSAKSGSVRLTMTTASR